MEELECSQGGGTEQRVLVRECVGLMRLLVRRDLMIMLPKKNFKEPTMPKANKLGAQHVKC